MRASVADATTTRRPVVFAFSQNRNECASPGSSRGTAQTSWSLYACPPSVLRVSLQSAGTVPLTRMFVLATLPVLRTVIS